MGFLDWLFGPPRPQPPRLDLEAIEAEAKVEADAKWRMETAVWREAEEEMRPIIRAHVHTLALKRQQLVVVDEYGVSHDERWEQEIERFYRVVANFGRRYSMRLWELHKGEYLGINFRMEEERRTKRRWIEEEIAECQSKPDVRTAIVPEALSPEQFEQYCAKLLAEAGWASRTTKGSGDQGVDVIAEKNGMKIVVQCKLQASPVGNKAVQEAIAGKAYERADAAIVVTNSSYTESAKQLASMCEVLLLHYTLLNGIDGLLRLTVADATTDASVEDEVDEDALGDDDLDDDLELFENDLEEDSLNESGLDD